MRQCSGQNPICGRRRSRSNELSLGVPDVRVIRVDFGVPAACPVRGNLGNAGCPVLPVQGIGYRSTTPSLICPTGKSGTACVSVLSSPDRKNISVFPKSDPLYIPAVSFPLEGRSRDRHGRRERDVMDAAASGAQIWSQGGFRLVSDQWRTDELSCRGRQSRVVLTPRRRRQVCGGFASPTGRTKP